MRLVLDQVKFQDLGYLDGVVVVLDFEDTGAPSRATQDYIRRRCA